MSDAKYVIRTSDRLAFKRCRQAWDFGSKIRMNFEPMMRPLPLDFGTAIHGALEVYYDPGFWHADRSIVQLSAKEEFVAICKDHKKDYLSVMDQEQMDELMERERFIEPLELGKGMLDHYFKWAPTVDNFKPLMVEIEFEVPILVPAGLELPPGFENRGGELYFEGLPVVYQGRCDLLIEDPFGNVWIVDHKTAGNFGSTEYLEMDEQCGSYIWALFMQLGVDVKGVIYNRLLKAAPKPPQELQRGGFSKNRQQRTTYELYKQTLIENGERVTDYIDFLEFLQDRGNPFFQRLQVQRSKTEMRNLANQICIEAIDMLNSPNIYPNVGMFTCMGCSYRTPCLAKMDGSDVNFVLKDLFRQRPQTEEQTIVVSD